MTESLKFLQNMQEITQLEIDQLDAAGQLTDVWNRPAIVKLPESYLKKTSCCFIYTWNFFAGAQFRD